MSYMKDFADRRLDSFVASRDLPGVLRAYDIASIPASVADGTAIGLLEDSSGWGQDLRQDTQASKPTVGTAAEGFRYLHFNGASFQRLYQQGFVFPPMSASGVAPVVSAPITHVAVVRIPSDAPANNVQLVISGGNSTVGKTIPLGVTGGTAAGSTFIAYTSGGQTVIQGGPPIRDSKWHILVSVVDPAWGGVYVDGYLVGQAVGTLGTNVLEGYSLGASADVGVLPLTGDIAYAATCHGSLTGSEILSIVRKLAAKFKIALPTVPARQDGVGYRDSSTASGAATRIYRPTRSRLRVVNGKATLLLHSHGAGGSEQSVVAVSGPSQYSFAHMAVNEGWYHAGSNMHGDNWGNDAGITDAVQLAQSVKDDLPAGVGLRIVLYGVSMGGLPTATMLARGDLANIGEVAGAYFVDPALDLQWAYNLGGAWPTAINTAYGVTSYAAIPAGHDPMARPASDYAGKRIRISASSADVTAIKGPNADAFLAKVGGVAAEASLLTHLQGHVGYDSWQPHDLHAFMLRCGA